MSLLVVGSIAFDSIETPETARKDVLGGSATHFTAASSFFTPTRIVGVVGTDFDLSLLGFLKERHADLSGVYAEEGKTFRWSGKYHANMNDRDTLSTELNVFGDFKPDIPDNFRDSDFLFLANINPDLQFDVLEQVRSPKFTALDTMNFWIEGSRPILEKVLKRVNCIILNDSEAQLFTNERNLVRAAKIVQKMGPETVIIKKGEHGAMLCHGGRFFIVPAFILEHVADPTGAGDSFAGGFMGHIAHTGSFGFADLKNAVVHGTCMASFCCEDFGSGRFITLAEKEIEERLTQLKELFTL